MTSSSKGAGDRKIQVIKVVREVVSGLGIKEAKDIVESAPKALFTRVDRKAAEAAKVKLAEAGALVRVKKSSPANRATRSETVNAQLTAVLGQFVELLGSPAAAAASLGIESSQLSPTGIRADHDRLSQLGRIQIVGSEFTKYWNRALFSDWLRTPNGHLNFSSPLQMLDLGETETVIAAIRSDAYGVYA